MVHDCARHDQQADMDFLRGACHALSALANPDLKMNDAVDAVRFLRAKAAAGHKVPPLMWFLGYVSIGYYPADVYRQWFADQGVDVE